MEIQRFNEALNQVRSKADLSHLTPDLLSYLKKENPDATLFREIQRKIMAISAEEGEAVQRLFDERFALDSLHPEVRGGVSFAAKKKGASEREISFRLAPLLALAKTFAEAKLITHSVSLLSREDAERLSKLVKEYGLGVIDIAVIGKHPGEMEALAKETTKYRGENS